MTDAMQPYWVSFYAAPSKGIGMKHFEYHGPWWESGYTFEDVETTTDDPFETGGVRVPTICAAVMARNEEEAIETLRLAFDEEHRPPVLEARFCELRSDREEPYSDRFQKRDWMQWPWPVVPLAPRPLNPQSKEDK